MTSKEHLLELQQTLYASKVPTRKWLHCSRRDWIVNAMHRYFPGKGGATALEIGPGSGVYLPSLAALFGQVTGIDIEDAFLEHAQIFTRCYPNLTILADDITRSRLPDRSFDLILCSEVIEHIEKAGDAVSEMRRLLKPGGILIMSTPQRCSTIEVAAKIAFLPGIVDIVKLIYREEIMEMGHINLMSEGQVKKLLNATGFNILEYFKSGLYLPVVAEFMGEPGLRLEIFLESKFRRLPVLHNLLWTQYAIARA